MIIRSYAGIPAAFVPDVGEVLLARQSPSQPFSRAVVLHVRRRRGGGVRLQIQFLPGPGEETRPAVSICTNANGVPQLFRQISREQAAAPDPEPDTD